MFFGKSWIVHLDLIPCSQVYSYSHTHTHTVCYGQDEVACYLYPTLGMQLPAAIQSPLFSFHLGCGYTRKETTTKKVSCFWKVGIGDACIMYGHTHTHCIFLSIWVCNLIKQLSLPILNYHFHTQNIFLSIGCIIR